MGLSYSYIVAEQKTWGEHTLCYDAGVREACRKSLPLFGNGEMLYLGYQVNSYGGLSYQHWFVTNNVWYLEFGSPSSDIYSVRVNINMHKHEPCILQNKIEMNDSIRVRMGHVLGVCNYSLCLRNCEHVANYVFRGRWISHQMDSVNNEKGILMNYFYDKMLDADRRKVNSFPASIRPHFFGDNSPNMYSFISDHPVANRFDYYLDWEENTYNILMVGPTGAGKSHLINTFFNQRICESEVKHTSVTKEIYFIRGVGDVYSPAKKGYERRDIVVADTIGLCDTEWDEEKVIKTIQGRVNANFKFVDAVFVVFRADRLITSIVESIRTILKWRCGKYDANNYQRFIFVATYADYLSDKKIKELRAEAISILKLHSTSGRRIMDDQPIDFLVYTGFAPEEYLNDLAKQRVLDSWESILAVIKNPLLSDSEVKSGQINRLNLQDKGKCNIL